MDRRAFLRSAVAAGLSTAAAPSLAARFAALTQVTGNVRAMTGEKAEIDIERAAIEELL